KEESPYARLAEDEAELVRAVGWVDVDQHEPDARGAVLAQDPLETVHCPDADAVAGGESERGEAGGDAGGGVVELGPGEARVLVADDERVAIGMECGGAVEGLRDGEVEEREAGSARLGEVGHSG